ncbi:unnamed protein product [Cunninghamella echinulata]
MKAVVFSCIITFIMLSSLLYYYLPNFKFNNLFTLIGCLLPLSNPQKLCQLLKPLLLTNILFLGPLSLLYFDHDLPGQRNFDWNRDIFQLLTSFHGIRNYIFAPLTEEFVFRACIIAILYQAKSSYTYLIFLSPCFFGLAHIHHGYELYHKYGKTNQALKRAIFSCTFQFAYTTIFGWYVSFIFLRTSSLWPPVLCHSFCNMMGFPDTSTIHEHSQKQRLVIWTCYILGPILFTFLLYPLSYVDDSFYW